MDINNIYLISNDASLTEEKINSIPISDNNIIVLFNHANPLNFSKIYNHPNKFLFLRANGQNEHIQYWGWENAIKHRSLYNKLFLINIRHAGIDSLLKHFSSVEIIDSDNNQELDYPSSRYPTSGFVAYNHIVKNFTDSKITLINFYGNDNPLMRHIHDYDYEQNFYKLNNITIIRL